MSRSGYNDYDSEYSDIRFINWRGAVKSALRGKRGQAFLREMLAAMDALPEKRLIAKELTTTDGEVCAIGAVARVRGTDVSEIDPEDHKTIASRFGIANAMACEIMYMNDEEVAYWRIETPEDRFVRMRKWIEEQIR